MPGGPQGGPGGGSFSDLFSQFFGQQKHANQQTVAETPVLFAAAPAMRAAPMRTVLSARAAAMCSRWRAP